MSACGPEPAPDDLPRRVFGELERPPDGEDLTERILRRLDAAGATRPRRRRWGVVLATALSIIAGGVALQFLLTPSRAPAGPTLPSAISSDLDRHEQTFDRAVRTIRRLAPSLAAPAATSPPVPEQERPVEPDEPPAEPRPAPEHDAGRA